ncbi:MAG: hypothetical protein ACRDXF_04075, partial [Acidimicrobiia bacterium]
MNHLIRSILCALALTACSTIVGDTPTETTGPGTTMSTPTTTMKVIERAQRDCTPVSTGRAPAATGSVAGDALLLSGEIFPCADDVVVVAETDLNEVATGAQLAAALGGPLLHPHPQINAELARLQPLRVHLVGEVDVATPENAEVLRATMTDAVDAARAALETSEEVRLPAVPDASTIVEAIAALTQRNRVVIPQTAPASTPTTAPVPPVIDPVAMINGLALPSGTEFAWMVPAGQPLTALSVAAAGRAIGASVVAYD